MSGAVPNSSSAGDGALVHVEHVSKRFAPTVTLGEKVARFFGVKIDARAVHAVQNVSFDIQKGEVLGLVGESGSGKSTLGRAIAGVHPASEGAVLIDNAPVMGRQGRKPRKTTTRIQMVFQDPFASLDPRVRVGDTIAEGPIAHGLTTKAAAGGYVSRWLKAVGLPEAAADRFPHQFSGGQRQRVAIARALAMQPDVLVCDEPVASLDVSIQAQIINLFLQLRREFGLTMLFISHDLGVVRHISDRVAIMYLGRIVEIGETDAIFDAPRHPYTRALLDSVPKLQTDSAELVTFKPIEGELPSPLSPPPGCHFHQRCPYRQPRCSIDVPALIGLKHPVACHYPLSDEER